MISSVHSLSTLQRPPSEAFYPNGDKILSMNNVPSDPPDDRPHAPFVLVGHALIPVLEQLADAVKKPEAVDDRD